MLNIDSLLNEGTLNIILLNEILLIKNLKKYIFFLIRENGYQGTFKKSLNNTLNTFLDNLSNIDLNLCWSHHFGSKST